MANACVQTLGRISVVSLLVPVLCSLRLHGERASHIESEADD